MALTCATNLKSFWTQPGLVRIFLTDAKKHGITASLNTVKILSENAIVKSTLPAPEALVRFLNTRFYALYDEYRIVFTCVIADIDIPNATMSIATAGPPEPYIISSGNAMPVKSRGSIIGFMEFCKYQSIMHFMNKGDIFLLYSDGLLDLIRNQHGAFNHPDFNAWEKLETRISSIDPHLSLDKNIAHILKPTDRASFSRNRTEDDITIIAIKLT